MAEQQASRRLDGKTVLLTGATNGIGRETAFALAHIGATVVLGCRRVDAAKEVADAIRAQHPDAKVLIPRKLDLADGASIKAFVEAYRQQGLPCHQLINNAGTNIDFSWSTPEGVPGLVQTNYLGPYHLTRLMEPLLVASAPSRVVNLSSIMHRCGFIKSAQDFLHRFRQGAYPSTKLANALFAFEHQRRLGSHGVQSCALDPGGVKSNIWSSGVLGKPPLSWVLGALYAPNADAAKVVVRAATDPWSEPDGKAPTRFYARGMFASPWITRYRHQAGRLGKLKYYLWGQVTIVHSLTDWPLRWLSGGLLASRPCQVVPAPASLNQQLAAELWDASADLVKVPRTAITG